MEKWQLMISLGIKEIIFLMQLKKDDIEEY